jgi:7,8-dihydro-6-hydroxymethylpterin-pyrophosphokinase
MAGVGEKFLPHLESMRPNSILDRVNDIEKYDRLARRNYGLSDNQGRPRSLNIDVLTQGRSVIRGKQQPNETPAQEQA